MTEPRTDAYRDDRAHVFHSWSAQRTLDPVVVEGGLGATFWDEAGTHYLDFSSQLVNLNLGHQHPRVVAAIQEQAARLCTIAPTFGNAARSSAARLIAGVAPGDLSHVFFTNGGTEANEHAIRMARATTGRHKILAAYRSYHGATTGSITLTGDPRRWANEPGMPGVVRFFGPYFYRSPFHADSLASESSRALEHLEEVFMLEGPQTIAAVILEPVVGTNGILVPPPGYLEGVRELCSRHGALLIADEVMSGFGRCGEWFAVDHWSVVPDLITFAKGVNSGYVPLGGVILGPRVYSAFAERPFPGGLTYSGHPLACAAAVATIGVMQDESIPSRVRDVGERVVRPRLEKLRDRHPSVGDVRGLGLFWAIELVRSKETREMLVPYNASGAAAKPMADVVAACKARGVWPFTHFNRVHVVPPLIISEEDLLRGIDAIDDALDVADAYVA
ncbi:aspartate aminotransferase family protein [Dactylosporangium sp. CS-033363]|uniref:aspartate aminotransferase family protein n=1 Tax=Dactylosporangium sp. CS-033363 TaxID=3239935 RepID=UPI003D8FAEA5